MRVEVGHLRAEQAGQREVLMSMKQQRLRMNRNAGNGATRSGGISLSRPDSRLARHVTRGGHSSAASGAPSAPSEAPMREHFEA